MKTIEELRTEVFEDAREYGRTYGLLGPCQTTETDRKCFEYSLDTYIRAVRREIAEKAMVMGADCGYSRSNMGLEHPMNGDERHMILRQLGLEEDNDD